MSPVESQAPLLPEEPLCRAPVKAGGAGCCVVARGLAPKETGAAPGLLTMVTFLEREWVLKVWELHRVVCGSRVWRGDGDPPFTYTFSFSAGQCFASRTSCLLTQCPLPTKCWEPPHYHVQTTSTLGDHGHHCHLPRLVAMGRGSKSTWINREHRNSFTCTVLGANHTCVVLRSLLVIFF